MVGVEMRMYAKRLPQCPPMVRAQGRVVAIKMDPGSSSPARIHHELRSSVTNDLNGVATMEIALWWETTHDIIQVLQLTV